MSKSRNYITHDDIPLIIEVVLSTASKERVTIFDLLLAYNGVLIASQIAISLNIALPTARRTMLELKVLGLVDTNDNSTEDSNSIKQVNFFQRRLRYNKSAEKIYLRTVIIFHHLSEDNNKLLGSFMKIRVLKRMRCFNCYSEFFPTISKPICKNCGFCHYCIDFSCFHHILESSAELNNRKEIGHN